MRPTASASSSASSGSASSHLSASVHHSTAPSASAVPPSAYHSASAVQSASRAFFLGLLLALLACALLVLLRGDGGGIIPPSSGGGLHSWRPVHQRANAAADAASDGLHQLSPLVAEAAATKADFAASAHAADLAGLAALVEAGGAHTRPVIPRGPYAQRIVVDRILQTDELARLQELDVPASGDEAAARAKEARARDQHSWQAQMAHARAEKKKTAATTISARTQFAADGGAAYAAAQAKLDERRARVASAMQPVPARPHPLVGPAGAAYYAQRTLILYLFYPADGESLANLEFFVETAVRAHHEADYVIILQKSELRPVDVKHLPKLPSNAKYVHFNRRDECGGLGPVGWLLRQQHPTEQSGTAAGANTQIPAVVTSPSHSLFVAMGHYAYTMIVDSSMRGPWFPTWIDLDDPARVWFAAFAFHLERNAPEMHLVGSTISCQYGQPHVQLGAVMVDQLGWSLLDANRTTLLRCVPGWKSTAHQAMAVSRAVLESGGNIGCQMLSHQELDFRVTDPASPARTCLGMGAGDPQYDELRGAELGNGHYMDPYELVFVKYTDEFRHYKSETFSDWKRWEAERMEENAKSDKYRRRWTEKDFREEDEITNKEEAARLQPLP